MPLHERFLPRKNPQVPDEKGTPFALSNGLGRYFVVRQAMKQDVPQHNMLTMSEENLNTRQPWQFADILGERMMINNGIRLLIRLPILPLQIPEGSMSGHRENGKVTGTHNLV